MQNHTGKPPAKPHLPALDGLRGFLSIFVVLAHTHKQDLLPKVHWIWGIGNFNLLLFFALSGFLMSYHYLPGKQNVRFWLVFLVRRFFRVYPTFLFTSLFLLWILHNRGMLMLDIFAHNYLQRYSDNQITNQLQLRHGAGYFWSVTTELKFYLLFLLGGLMFFVIAPLLGRAIFPILCGLFAVLMVLDVADTHFLPLSNRGPTMLFFTGGMLVEQCIRRYPAAVNRIPAISYDLLFAGGMLLAMYLSGILSDQALWYQWPMAILASALLFCAAQSQGILKDFLTLPPFLWLGEISFSLYLTHSLVFMFSRSWLPIPGHMAWMAALPLAFVLAAVCYAMVEHPCHRFGIWLSRRMMPKDKSN